VCVQFLVPTQANKNSYQNGVLSTDPYTTTWNLSQDAPLLKYRQLLIIQPHVRHARGAPRTRYRSGRLSQSLLEIACRNLFFISRDSYLRGLSLEISLFLDACYINNSQ
jgi:hypothetical protein